MRKKTVVTVISILLAVIFLAGAVYHFPWPTKIDKTLTVTKLDADGNEIGTFDVHITGKQLNYLFKEDRMLLKIDPFDNIEDIQTTESSDVRGKDTTGVVSYFGQEHGKNYRLVYLEGYDRSNSLKYVTLSFCLLGDFDNFEEISIHCSAMDVVSHKSTQWSYVAFGDGR